MFIWSFHSHDLNYIEQDMRFERITTKTHCIPQKQNLIDYLYFFDWHKWVKRRQQIMHFLSISRSLIFLDSKQKLNIFFTVILFVILLDVTDLQPK